MVLEDHDDKNGDERPEKEPESEQHDPYYEPIISLPEVNVPTLEENEDVLIILRAKLYRMEALTKEWKERGTGEVKMLHNIEKNTVRIVMRRDKTLKICANHYITSEMNLKTHSKNERAWVYTTHADFADETPKAEIFAIMFLNAEIAKIWKIAFENAQSIISVCGIAGGGGVGGDSSKLEESVRKSLSSSNSDLTDSDTPEYYTPDESLLNKSQKKSAITSISDVENKLSEELKKFKIESTVSSVSINETEK